MFARVSLWCSVCRREAEYTLKFTRYLAYDVRERLEKLGWHFVTADSVLCPACQKAEPLLVPEAQL